MDNFRQGAITSPGPNRICLYCGTRLYKCGVLTPPKNLRHIAPIPAATGLGTRLRELDFFSFFRFTEGFFDGGALLLPGRSFRDGGASVVEGGLLPDAIICSSSSLWYAWCNEKHLSLTCASGRNTPKIKAIRLL